MQNEHMDGELGSILVGGRYSRRRRSESHLGEEKGSIPFQPRSEGDLSSTHLEESSLYFEGEDPARLPETEQSLDGDPAYLHHSLVHSLGEEAKRWLRSAEGAMSFVIFLHCGCLNSHEIYQIMAEELIKILPENEEFIKIPDRFTLYRLSLRLQECKSVGILLIGSSPEKSESAADQKYFLSEEGEGFARMCEACLLEFRKQALKKEYAAEKLLKKAQAKKDKAHLNVARINAIISLVRSSSIGWSRDVQK